MDIHKLTQRADDALANASYDPKKLALIYIGATLLVTLVLSLINILLSTVINSAGGLSNIGLRSAISTFVTLLSLAQAILTPIWQAGWLFVTLQLLRQQQTGPRNLLGGFSRFWPLIRLTLLELLIVLGLVIVGSYLSTFIFLLTPWSRDFLTMYDPTITADQLLASGGSSVIVLLIIMAVVLLVLIIPVVYRLRLSQYFLLDNPQYGARMSMYMSRFAMKKKCWKLFRVELHFWWYYVLLGLTATLPSIGDAVELITKKSIGIWGDLALLLIMVAGELLIAGYFMPRVDVTYAAFYEAAIPEQWKNVLENTNEAD